MNIKQGGNANVGLLYPRAVPPGAGQVHDGMCSHLNHNFRRHLLIVSGRYRLGFNPFGEGG